MAPIANHVADCEVIVFPWDINLPRYCIY